MTGRVVRSAFVLALALAVLLGGSRTPGQMAGGFELTLVDVDGARKALGQLPPSVYAPRISPDGRRVAFETRDPSGRDGARLWVADLSDLAGRRPLPRVDGVLNWAPMWSPDGERLVFIVSSDRGDAVYWRRADGTGDAEHLLDTRAAEGWNAGGAQLRFLTLTGDRDYGISFFDMKSRTSTPFVDLPGSAQHSSSLSPDGRWMAYASNETGRYEVWIESVPRTGTRYQMTRDGGSHPLWRPDGRALYFDRDHQMFRLDVNTQELSARVQPSALPVRGFAQAEYRRQFDLMPDGRQFLMLFPMSP